MNTAIFTPVQKTAQAKSTYVQNTSIGLNRIMTQANTVSPLHMAHYVNMKEGIAGLENLICKILRQHGAEFPANIETSELRPLALAASMTIQQVEIEVQAEFARQSKRYPHNSVKTYLGTFMSKDKCNFRGEVVRSPIVRKVQLTTAEDRNRECNKPRTVFYLIAQ